MVLGQSEQTAIKFRAIAPVVGLPHRGYLSSQGKQDEMPVLCITGKKDTTVPPGMWEA